MHEEEEEWKDISSRIVSVIFTLKQMIHITHSCILSNTLWCRAFPRGNHEMIELERSKQSTQKVYGKINRKKTNKEKWPMSVFPRFWPSHRRSLWTLSRHKWIMECFSFFSTWRTHTHTYTYKQQPKSLHYLLTYSISLPLTLDRDECEYLSNLKNTERGGVKGKVIAISVYRQLRESFFPA